MGLVTRLDGRTEANSSFMIKDKEGDTIAEIKLVSRAGSTIHINTKQGLYVEKPNGWVNKKRLEDS